MKIPQKEKLPHTNQDTISRSGGPIDNPPDIRKIKNTKKNVIIAAAIFILIGLGGIYTNKITFLTQSTSITRTHVTTGEVAKDMIAFGLDESQGNIEAHENHLDKDIHVHTDNLPEKTIKKMAVLSKKSKNYLDQNQDSEAILSKCHIHGHDVHYINRSGTILSHVKHGEILPPPMSRAREIILLNKNQSGISVIVKKDSLEVYNSSGSLEAKESFKPE